MTAAPDPGGGVTPAHLRELAGRVSALAADVARAHQALRDADDPVRRTGFRLDDVVGSLHRGEAELAATATDLARVVAASDPRICTAQWGVCPEHGNTLTSSGGMTRCRTCGRTWSYDRVGTVCTEPATYLVTDPHGGTVRLCQGHAIDVAETQGWTITEISDGSCPP